ncbi:MAG: AarF/ABC1/UbiB kinase family protein [Pirellulaceae bacterium]|nr:AarF/ABC1/UbiB kinase family protein [Pirellulaceae bacterium]MDG2104899.1 AarF/ABC1/UbiB kinase family protein [Pirellulaceae bacterium]
MKRTLPSIPHLYRNMRRWTEIFAVLSKYGLADWLSRLNIEFVKNQLRSPDGDALARLTTSERIRLALSELGPTFIKFGQLLSTRPDLVGVELASELAKLQAAVPADSFDKVKQIIESEQARPLEEIFLSFNPQPLASASIGQVHLAKLTDGRDVIVKVRHAGIEHSVATDLDILTGLAQMAERSEEFRPYHPKALVAEMARTMPRELDFRLELRSQTQFAKKFEHSKVVQVPEVFPEFSSEKMLTMELMQGFKLTDMTSPDDLSAQLNVQGHGGLDLSETARNGANLYLQMIFDDGLYHADPHPGNIMIMPDGRIGLLDYGMVGRISEQLREDIEAMLVAIVNSDVVLLVALVKRVGSCPMDLNEGELSAEVADFVAHFSMQSMSSFDMSAALNEFVSIVRKFHITLPGEAAMLIKVLIQLEGTGRLLDPQFSLMGIMKPFHRKLLMRRLSPARQARKVRRLYMQMEQLAESLPQTIGSILEQMKRGKFDVHLDHRRLGPSVNRLVLGMMTSALFLGSSLMLSREVPPLLFANSSWMGIRNLSLLGISGCIASVFLGVRLYLAIRHSGNLDE